jgi:hypothetical protein
MYTHFDQPFFEYGNFPLADANGTRLDNPWKNTKSNTSPFDQDFYRGLSSTSGRRRTSGCLLGRMAGR